MDCRIFFEFSVLHQNVVRTSSEDRESNSIDFLSALAHDVAGFSALEAFGDGVRVGARAREVTALAASEADRVLEATTARGAFARQVTGLAADPARGNGVGHGALAREVTGLAALEATSRGEGGSAVFAGRAGSGTFHDNVVSEERLTSHGNGFFGGLHAFEGGKGNSFESSRESVVYQKEIGDVTTIFEETFEGCFPGF